jgi:amphi-Trp domain-containing protein
VRRDIEKIYGRKAFIASLRRLARALERGERYVLQVAGRRIAVPRDAVLGIEHEREGGCEEIEFQLKWKPARRRRAVRR